MCSGLDWGLQIWTLLLYQQDTGAFGSEIYEHLSYLSYRHQALGCCRDSVAIALKVLTLGWHSSEWRRPFGSCAFCACSGSSRHGSAYGSGDKQSAMCRSQLRSKRRKLQRKETTRTNSKTFIDVLDSKSRLRSESGLVPA